MAMAIPSAASAASIVVLAVVATVPTDETKLRPAVHAAAMGGPDGREASRLPIRLVRPARPRPRPACPVTRPSEPDGTTSSRAGGPALPIMEAMTET